MKTLVIVGAGGHGKVVADAATEMALWDDIIFVDAAYPAKTTCSIWPIVGSNHLDQEFSSADFIVAVGNNDTRLKISKDLKENGRKLVNVVHPNASVSRLAKLGDGVAVFSGSVVNIGVEVRDAVIVNTGATVDHDCVLCEGVHISPGANIAGEVNIGACSWIGIGSAVKQVMNIGDNVVVGAGATVVSNVADGITVVGTPAKQLI